MGDVHGGQIEHRLLQTVLSTSELQQAVFQDQIMRCALDTWQTLLTSTRPLVIKACVALYTPAI